MTEAAAISGSLVDVRNVGTHKSVKLTIHVPEEFATRVVAAFGWPTGAHPVSVAIARLMPAGNTTEGQSAVQGPSETPYPLHSHQATPPQPSPVSTASEGAGVEKRKSPAQIAGYLCTLPGFQSFLAETFTEDWDMCAALFSFVAPNEKVAAECVRLRCDVQSRSQITEDNPGWREIISAYRAVEKAAEIVPA